MHKKICILFITLLLLSLTACSKPKTLVDLQTEYEANKSNIDITLEYIDMLLLEDQKEKAYSVLCDAQTKVIDQEQFNKLREYTQYFKLREVESNYYDQDGKLSNVIYTRYDENGRIIQKGDTTRIYPDDGGDVYYYTLDSYIEQKNCYDKEDRIIYSYSNAYYLMEENIVPYNDIYNVCTKYTYEFDSNGNVTKKTTINQTGNKVLYSIVETYKYDDSNKLIQSDNLYYDENGNNTSYSTYVYEYDDHGNILNQITKSSYSDNDSIINYVNEYDSDGYLIKQTTIYDNGNGYTTYTEYTYDKLFDLILTEKGQYQSCEKKYELVTSNADGIGLKDDAITFVSGNATRAVTKREILATNIKVRKTPTTHEDNFIENVSKGTVVNVYDSVYNEGYIWHEIGVNRWIADDRTWTKEVSQ